LAVATGGKPVAVAIAAKSVPNIKIYQDPEAQGSSNASISSIRHSHHLIYFSTIGQYNDTVTRTQALTLKAVSWTNAKIQQITNIPPRTLNDILNRAIKAKYIPIHPNSIYNRLNSSYVANAPKSSHPNIQKAI